MKYLVDANVLSEPTKAVPETRVVGWLTDHEADLGVDAIVLGELYVGVLALSEGRKRARLEAWFDALARAIECLPGMRRSAGDGLDWCLTYGARVGLCPCWTR
ncbi:MAG: hypothetical protein M5U12_27955 [Verrucomicrobia bacterium]|nr:hypothetical protein [Verrucomicrobiota bacterium]